MQALFSNFSKFFSTQRFTKGCSTIGNTLLTGCRFFLILIYVIKITGTNELLRCNATLAILKTFGIAYI